MAYKLTLPFPVSANSIWRKHQGRIILTQKARLFRLEVKQAVINQLGLEYKSMTGKLKVELEIFMPDKRKRDLDNLLKSTLDALEKVNVFQDDCQIEELYICKNQSIIKGGKLNAIITEIFNFEGSNDESC